jgi:hypothetical protein
MNSAQFNIGKRIINASNIAFYDAMRQKFATHDIYCPEPVDLANKLRALAQWDYNWTFGDNQLEIQLDLSNVRSDTIARYIGGMGIKIENTNSYIQQVFINNQLHEAFSDRLVILPNLKKEINKIRIILAAQPAATAHLTFISKRMPSIKKSADRLEVDLLTRSKGKFNFYVREPFVLLNADQQEYNRKNDGILKGAVNSDRQLVLERTKLNSFTVTQATLPISEYHETSSQVSLKLKSNGGSENSLWFSCSQEPKMILFNSQKLETEKKLSKYLVRFPEIQKETTLIIKF